MFVPTTIFAHTKFRSNILHRLIFFSCHVDTVEPREGIKVIEKNDILYTKDETILAADNKAGIAILSVA